ncbi:hypothetical protein [Bradyrhizobium prioriisuperbiae]|uniref:hypothetical protein n=1 Tax=Bradyrhizobium prioriisuperbiae TaxID=2854389 RepID=UPI0028ED8595|nr:hypothetical protein [Bradyrhizobium prioritasuperba]
MGRVHPAQRSRPPPPVDEHDGEQPDVRALIEENTRLKQLVLQLSCLVLKNAVDRK